MTATLLTKIRRLMGNDVDADGFNDSISAVPATTRSNLGAEVIVNADGSFSYNPSQVTAIQRLTTGQSTIDTFSYKIKDSFGTESNSAIVTVRVDGINDAPIAVDDRFSIGVGQTRLLDVLANDSDVDSAIDGRTIQITNVPIFGTVVVNQTGIVQYVAEAGFRGTDTFAYVVRDALGAVSNEATVAVIVNTPPVANPDVTFTYKNESIAIPVLINDADPDGSVDLASIRVVSGPAPSGTATVNANGTILFTPANNFSGEVTLSYVVSDNVGTTSNVAKVTVRVLNSKWQNPVQNLDVNGDGKITPIDALLVINYLNDPNSERFLPNTSIVPPPFLDVDANERVSANDALLIINYLNERSAGGEAEGEDDGFSYAMMVTPQQMVDTVGAAVVQQVQRMLSQLRAEAMLDTLGPTFGGLDAAEAAAGYIDDLLIGQVSSSLEETESNEKEEGDGYFAELGKR
jgi:large repetitive protein